ncbi:MAG: hypothetical protein GFH27_549291n91 [Chloroflexi bacterium AL-W]|nr:hypothetical protein [Chloroflexi bacterium AL-N1]NOK67442.1 hypothetical protein [Chloroflexi bacterium AL-N10]NOK75066.1 hypothetical protein [Chloroflexi bacterium AL-N5]NOK81853.1 hypothetical protein [Chloroflexi bacterium AL-W]NOK89699.1 hypothetical protein [Chloroflexi bacterium AL-N15]
MSAADGMSVNDLGQRCTEETHKFNRRVNYDPQYCFELFRRALGTSDSEALTFLWQIYERQVVSWVYSHGSFKHTGEEAEFFAHQALINFYFALRGDKMDRFTSLQRVLAYLKACVHTAVMQYIRDQKADMNRSINGVEEQSLTPDLHIRLDMVETWQRVEILLPDHRDRVLAHCILVQRLKPREIVKEFPDLWQNEREISVASFRIRRILRRDGSLQRRYENSDDLN